MRALSRFNRGRRTPAERQRTRASRTLRGALCLLALGIAGAPGAGRDALAGPAPQAGSAPAQGLIWPLDPPHSLRAVYGEYREGGRVHGGVDLSTGGRTGLPVRAAGDGEAFRIKVEWRGYGRAVYQRLPDRRILVYAHLERFVLPGLEKALAEARKTRGRYPGDIEISPPIPVRRGELLALSGESGAGLPHLHFEVRTADNSLSDPQAALPPLADPDPPVFEAIWVYAASPESWVNGASWALRLPARRGSKNEWGSGPVRVSGPVDLAVELFDPAPEEGRLGVPVLALRWDGREISASRAGPLAFSDGRRASAIHDASLSHLSPTRFAYRPLGPRGSPWMDGDPPLRLEGAPGASRIAEIEAHDASGNVAVLRLPVQFLRPEEIARQVAPPSQPERSPDLWPLLPERALWLGGAVALPLGDADPGAAAPSLFRILTGGGTRPLAAVPWAPVGSRPGVEAAWVTAALPSSGAILFQPEREGAPLRAVQRRMGGSPLTVICGSARVRLRAGALPRGSAVSVQEQREPRAPDAWRETSPAIRIEPAWRIPASPLRLRLRTEPGRYTDSRLGIYRWDAWKKRWIHAGGTGQARAGTLEIEAGELGTFRLLEDVAPPVWGEKHPGAGEKIDPERFARILIGLEDVGSGITWEAVAVELDGREIEVDYDPDRKRLEARPPAPLPEGEHFLRARARDRAGNEAPVLEWRFEIRR